MKHWGLMFRQTILHPKFGEYSGPFFEGDKRQWHTLKRRATMLSKHWCNFFCWYGSPVNAASEATSWWVCFPFIAGHLPCYAQLSFTIDLEYLSFLFTGHQPLPLFCYVQYYHLTALYSLYSLLNIVLSILCCQHVFLFVLFVCLRLSCCQTWVCPTAIHDFFFPPPVGPLFMHHIGGRCLLNALWGFMHAFSWFNGLRFSLCSIILYTCSIIFIYIFFHMPYNLHFYVGATPSI